MPAAISRPGSVTIGLSACNVSSDELQPDHSMLSNTMLLTAIDVESAAFP